ncbi:MAG: glycosyltransferase family 2 protein [Pseudohongiellaceae bacterium]
MSGLRSGQVLVLLAVWNGSRWLAEQIDSILRQQDVEVSILCRDDGSTDDSPAILQHYHRQFPGQVRLLEDDLGNLGACGSFSQLMKHALEVDLKREPGLAVALADQDDIWHPERLSVTLTALDEAAGPGGPVLVHTDLRVVNEALEPVAPSLARYQGLRPWQGGLPAQLLGNSATGCTVLMNLELLQLALPVPVEAVMHDWWLSLVASLYGQRVYVDRPLVDYRQHGENAVGAKALQPRRWTGIRQWVFDRSSQPVFEQIAVQAEVFRQRHGDCLTRRQRLAVQWVLWLPRLPAPLQKVLFRLLRLL